MPSKWSLTTEYIQSCNCAYGCPCNFNALPTTGNCEALNGFKVTSGSLNGVKLDGVKFAVGLWWPKAIHEGNGAARLYIDGGANPAQKKAVEDLNSGRHGGGAFEVFPKTFSKVYPTKTAKIEWTFRGHDSRFAVAGFGEVASSHIRNPVTNEPFEGQIMLPGGIAWKKSDVTSVDWWLRDPDARWDMSHRKASGFVATITFTEKGPQ
jgi:hypothetical protein